MSHESNSQEDFALFITIVIRLGVVKPGDTLVYDNAAVHFGDDTATELFDLFAEYDIKPIPLPKYSPELNPIERVFNIVKIYLRHHRDKSIPLLEDIINGFATVTHAKLLAEYICSRDMIINDPLCLPPELECLLRTLI